MAMQPAMGFATHRRACEGGPLLFDWKASLSVADFVSLALGDSRPWKVNHQDNKTVPARKTAKETKSKFTQGETSPVEAKGEGFPDMSGRNLG
jgi:hypothetical protein